jgi:hypothetical protein
MCKRNLNRKGFLTAIARQLCQLRKQAFFGKNRDNAYIDAGSILDLLQGDGIKFGNKGFDWNEPAAIELANNWINGEFTAGERLP